MLEINIKLEDREFHCSLPAMWGHGAGPDIQVLLNLTDTCPSCPGITDEDWGTNFTRAIMLPLSCRCGTIRRASIPYLPTWIIWTTWYCGDTYRPTGTGDNTVMSFFMHYHLLLSKHNVFKGGGGRKDQAYEREAWWEGFSRAACSHINTCKVVGPIGFCLGSLTGLSFLHWRPNLHSEGVRDDRESPLVTLILQNQKWFLF